MHEFIGTIVLMDGSDLYLILAISAGLSYLLYESIGSWMIGVISMPLFSLSSLIAIHVMQKTKMYLATDDTTNVIFATAAGSIIGLAVTIGLIRVLLAKSSARLKRYQSDKIA